MISKEELAILKEQVRVYEDALEQIKTETNIDDANAIAFVALNHDFEE